MRLNFPNPKSLFHSKTTTVLDKIKMTLYPYFYLRRIDTQCNTSSISPFLTSPSVLVRLILNIQYLRAMKNGGLPSNFAVLKERDGVTDRRAREEIYVTETRPALKLL